MPASRKQLVAALRSGDSYEEAARTFGIPPGQAYLIVTGLPADGSDVLGLELLAEKQEFLLDGGSQHLANPPTEVPTKDEGVLDWIKQRARADAPLQAAAAARGVEPPPPEVPDDRIDVVDVLGRQHNQVNYLLEQLTTIPGDTDEQRRRQVAIVRQLHDRLTEHEDAEQQHFWPAVREHVPDGAQLAEQAEQQERHGADLLEKLNGTPADADDFSDLVGELASALHKHVAFEDGVFLRARQHIPDDQRTELGRKVQQ